MLGKKHFSGRKYLFFYLFNNIIGISFQIQFLKNFEKFIKNVIDEGAYHNLWFFKTGSNQLFFMEWTLFWSVQFFWSCRLQTDSISLHNFELEINILAPYHAGKKIIYSSMAWTLIKLIIVS